jgi:outer membrane protein TolC
MASKLVKMVFPAVASVVLSSAGVRAERSITLDEGLRLSQEHSLDVKANFHDSLSARLDLAAARALRFPTLSLSATSYYTDVVQEIEVPFNRIELGSHENYLADMKLTVPLFAGGRISNQIRIQSAMAESRGYNLESARYQTAYQTRKAFLALMLAQSGVAASEASFKRVEIVNRDVRNLYSGGLADSVDILDAELALEKARGILDERRTAEGNASATLARLTGIPLNESLSPILQLPPPDFEVYENIAYTPEKIDRPELKVLENSAEAAHHVVGLNRATYLPSLNGFGGYTVGKPNRDLVNEDWNDYWTVGLNLIWEFNLGGRSLRTVSSAREMARSAELSRDDIEESFKLAAIVAYENLRQAFRNYSVSQREFEISARKYELGLQKQRVGRLSVNRLLELEADLAASEQLYRSSIINYFLFESDYLYSIGSSKIYGGF